MSQLPNLEAKISRTKDNWVTEKEWNPVGWPVFLDDEGSSTSDFGYCLITGGMEDKEKAIQVTLTENFLVQALSELRHNFYSGASNLEIKIKEEKESADDCACGGRCSNH